jgi:hypothetical protein
MLHDTSAIIWWILSWVHNIMYHVLIFSLLSTEFKIDGEDYIESMGTFTFAPWEQRKVIQVPIINDVLLENKEEAFFIRLMVTSLAPGLLVGTSIVTVTIIDDDCKCACRCMLEIFEFLISLIPVIGGASASYS